MSTRGMNQAQRLLELYDRLLAGNRIDSAYIQSTYNITRRQASRDLVLLSDVLGPQLQRTREGGGRAWWQLQGREKTRNVVTKQVFAIAAGSRLASFLAGSHFEPETSGILHQLTSELRRFHRQEVHDLRERIHVIKTGQKNYNERLKPQHILTDLVKSMLLDLQLELTYLSHRRAQLGAAPRKLTVAPLTMVLYRNAVYFVVEVLGGTWSGPARILLALDRIQSARLTTVPFQRPASYAVEDFFSDAFAISTAGPLHDVTLRISPTMADYTEERFWHTSAQQRWMDDGWLHLRMKVRGSEVLEWVRNMGRHVEVLSPPALRIQMREELLATLKHYAALDVTHIVSSPEHVDGDKQGEEHELEEPGPSHHRSADP